MTGASALDRNPENEPRFRPVRTGVPTGFLACATACLLLIGLTAGCSSDRNSALDDDVVVTWHISPDPPEMGEATVTVTLADTTGRPIEGADVSLEGVMTHPGMAPSMAEARETAPGRYDAPLQLTMAGDWILLLEASLPDGRHLSRQKDLPAVRPD